MALKQPCVNTEKDGARERLDWVDLLLVGFEAKTLVGLWSL